MARMPGTNWLGEHAPIQSNGQRLTISRYDIVCVHTIVGYAPAHAAHFSTHHNGQIDQSRDTKYRSGANLDGNYRIIAIENEDHGSAYGSWNVDDGHAVPGFTDAQIEAIAQICAWAHITHGIPLVACPNSRPESRGIAYHRQGIDGNFDDYDYPGRVSGGEVWTLSFGKVCPGDERIHELLEKIIARAQAIVNGEPLMCDLNNSSANKAIIEAGVHDYANTGDDWRVEPPNGQTSTELAEELGFSAGNRSLVWKAEAGFYYGALAVKLLEQLLNQPSPPGTGATAAEVRQIVQEELAKLGIDYTP